MNKINECTALYTEAAHGKYPTFLYCRYSVMNQQRNTSRHRCAASAWHHLVGLSPHVHEEVGIYHGEVASPWPPMSCMCSGMCTCVVGRETVGSASSRLLPARWTWRSFLWGCFQVSWVVKGGCVMTPPLLIERPLTVPSDVAQRNKGFIWRRVRKITYSPHIYPNPPTNPSTSHLSSHVHGATPAARRPYLSATKLSRGGATVAHADMAPVVGTYFKNRWTWTSPSAWKANSLLVVQVI